MSAADTCKQRGIPTTGMPLLLFRPGGYQKIGIHFPSSPEEGISVTLCVLTKSVFMI